MKYQLAIRIISMKYLQVPQKSGTDIDGHKGIAMVSL